MLVKIKATLHNRDDWLYIQGSKVFAHFDIYLYISYITTYCTSHSLSDFYEIPVQL